MALVNTKKQKNKFRKSLIYTIITLVIFIILSLFYARYLENRNTGQLTSYNKVLWEVGSRTITLEIANTPAERYLGLSGRKDICLDCGMIFSFPEKKEQSFVMRNMNFPLDIIYIADGEIVKIYHNLRPEGDDPQNIYASKEPIDYVIELRGSRAKTLQIKEGDRIKLPEILGY